MGITSALIRLCLSAATFGSAGGTVLVAVQSGVGAYAEALEGLGSTLGANSLRVVELPQGKLPQELNAPDVQIIVAIGSQALSAVNTLRKPVPVIATMVLHDSQDGCARVELDIPLASQLDLMRSLWPGRNRVGIIRNPGKSHYSAEALEAQARKQGFTAVVLDCDTPARLLKALGSLRGKVDFLLSFPDAELYNPLTIRPLILESLESRLPIVGFSPAFVRAGAAAGVYPDYREVGRQTGEMVLRRLRGEDRAADEGPRKIRIAVNQRVARLLGIEFHVNPSVEVLR